MPYLADLDWRQVIPAVFARRHAPQVLPLGVVRPDQLHIRLTQRSTLPGPKPETHCLQQGGIVNICGEAARLRESAKAVRARAWLLRNGWDSRRDLRNRRRQPLPGQTRPVKAWSGIVFASGCHTGVTDHPCRRDLPTLQNPAQERFQSRHLRRRKGVIPAIVEFDPDGARIDIALPAPFTCTRMPGAIRLAHHLPQHSISADQIMGRNLILRIAKPVERSFGALQCGVVKDNQLWAQRISTRIEVGARMPDGGLALLRHARNRGHATPPSVSSAPRGDKALDPNRKRSHRHRDQVPDGHASARPPRERRSGPVLATQSPRNCARSAPQD